MSDRCPDCGDRVQRAGGFVLQARASDDGEYVVRAGHTKPYAVYVEEEHRAQVRATGQPLFVLHAGRCAQLDLWSQAESGMERASEGESEDFVTGARRWIAAYLETHETFFAEDACPECPVQPESARAWGSIVAWASRSGLMHHSGFRPRAKGHGAPGKVFTSDSLRRSA